MCNFLYGRAIKAKLDPEYIEVCKLLDTEMACGEADMWLKVMLIERLWGVDFMILTDKERQQEVQNEFNHLMKKETGVEKRAEVVKQRTRDTRMELVAEPTPAEVKNKALKMWMNKVSARVSALKNFDALIVFYYRNSMSKFAQEVFDQWVIKNESALTKDENHWIAFLQGRITGIQLMELVEVWEQPEILEELKRLQLRT